MEVWKMLFLFNWVKFSFQMSMFGGAWQRSTVRECHPNLWWTRNDYREKQPNNDLKFKQTVYNWVLIHWSFTSIFGEKKSSMPPQRHASFFLIQELPPKNSEKHNLWKKNKATYYLPTNNSRFLITWTSQVNKGVFFWGGFTWIHDLNFCLNINIILAIYNSKAEIRL